VGHKVNETVGCEHPATVVPVGRDDSGDVDEGKGARGRVEVADAA
jgi:hypothetical protein